MSDTAITGLMLGFIFACGIDCLMPDYTTIASGRQSATRWFGGSISEFTTTLSPTAMTPKENMSGPSPLSTSCAHAFAMLTLAIATPCMSDTLPQSKIKDPILEYRNTPELHGLFEIRAEVRSFLKRQPRKKSGDWVVVGPDIRMAPLRCVVPLRSRWARASDNIDGRPGVMVTCKKTNDAKEPRWTTIVDVMIPAEHEIEMRRLYPSYHPESTPRPE